MYLMARAQKCGGCQKKMTRNSRNAGHDRSFRAAAVICGGAFLFEVHRLYARSRREENVATIRLFHLSVLYLTVLFVFVAIGAFIR